MAIAASAPVLPNQKKQCCKIARFTDAPCTFKITRIVYLDIRLNYLYTYIIILSCACQCFLQDTLDLPVACLYL